MNQYEAQYLEFGKKLIDQGVSVFNTRTGKHRITLPHANFTYDASIDSFPLLTVKQTFAVSAVAEILGYLRGYRNAEDFEKIGTKTWRSNTDETPKWVNSPVRIGRGDMGQAYRFRSYTVTQPIRKACEKYDNTLNTTGVIPYKKPLLDVSDEDCVGLVGEWFESNSCGRFRVITEHLDNPVKTNYYTVQFEGTGYIKSWVQKSNIIQGTVKDPYSPMKYGNCLGNPDRSHPMYKILYRTWESIFTRLNDLEDNPTYEDVKVCDEWLVFENFLKDFEYIEGWQLKQVFPKDFSLDKDWCGSKVYSKHTTKWASRKSQARNTKSNNTYAVYDLKANEVLSLEKSLTSILENYPVGAKLLAKAVKNCDELDITPIGKTGDYGIRKVAGDFTCTEVDQFKEIYAKLLTSGDDHRLLMTAWIPHNGELSCLLPCMHSHQFSVLGDELFLTSIQRSVDYPLGQPFNAVQCVFLLKLMAKLCNLKPAKVFHTMSNVHIYEDQLDIFKSMLKREPLDTVNRVEFKESLFTFKNIIDSDLHAREYFTLTDYEHQGKIEFPFSA